MSHSDIFDSYAKLMTDMGLVKRADENDTKPSKSLLDQDTYSYFYPKKNMLGATLDMDGKPYDMLDKAHPETVVVSPAYDALNGVVENLKEQSNVMKMIALKTPRIILTQERYVKALQETIDETIKLGFFLDSKDMVELAKLADICSEQLSKLADGSVSNAIAGGAALAAPLIGLAAGAGGAGTAVIAGLALAGWLLWANRHPIGLGIKEDLIHAVKETKGAIIGFSGHEALASILNPVIEDMESLLGDIDAFYAKTDLMQTEILKIKLAANDEDKKKLLEAYGKKFISSGDDKYIRELSLKIKKTLEALISTIPDIIGVLETSEEKYGQSDWGHSTFYSSILAPLTKTYWNVIGRDTDDAIEQLEIIEGDTQSFYSYMNNFIRGMDAVRSQIPNVENLEKPESQKKTEEKVEQQHKEEDDKKARREKEKAEIQKQIEMMNR